MNVPLYLTGLELSEKDPSPTTAVCLSAEAFDELQDSSDLFIISNSAT